LVSSAACKFFQKLLALVLSGRESGVVVANSLALLARLLLQNPKAFEQLIGRAAAAGTATAADQQQQQQQQASVPGGGGSRSAEELLLALVTLWCEGFDSIAQPLARKLSACGLAALLGLPVKVSSGSSSSSSRRMVAAVWWQQWRPSTREAAVMDAGRKRCA
jgi:hypothetical protein